MRLILARHGNTFSAGEKVFWVGGNNDLPLVAGGIAQAERAGHALKDTNLAAVYCAPLLRTKQFAEIALKVAGIDLPIQEDVRLKEIDYGHWCGQTDAEIVEQFGEGALKGWVESSSWPHDGGWSSDETTVQKEVESFVQELTDKFGHQSDDNILIVSSNGKLRYFLHLIAGEFNKRVLDHSFKVATGRICVLESADDNFNLRLWNADPESLKELVAAK